MPTDKQIRDDVPRGLSRRRFIEILAEAGLIGGAAAVSGRSLFAQAPAPPSNVTVGTMPASGGGTVSGFAPQSGFSLSGNLAEGSTLTIAKSGGGFGAKPNGAAPLYWWPFERDLALSPLSRGTFTGSLRGEIATTVRPRNAAGALRFDMYIKEGGGVQGADVGANKPKVFVWLRRYWGLDASEGVKPFRFWPQWPPGGSPDYYHSFDAGQKGSKLTVENPTDSNWFHVEDVALSQWQVEEYYHSIGSIDVADSIINYEQNARLGPLTTQRWLLRTSANPGYLRYCNFDQCSNSNWAPGSYIYHSGVYIDDSWCRVVISDEPSYQHVTREIGTPPYWREIQIPTAWSDGSVSFVLRQGAHSSLAGKSLYVLRNDGTPFKVGAFS